MTEPFLTVTEALFFLAVMFAGMLAFGFGDDSLALTIVWIGFIVAAVGSALYRIFLYSRPKQNVGNQPQVPTSRNRRIKA